VYYDHLTVGHRDSLTERGPVRVSVEFAGWQGDARRGWTCHL